MPQDDRTPAGGTDKSKATPAWLGKTVAHFKLLGLLGRGAYGRVFLAEDLDLERRVALKVVTADAAAKSARRRGTVNGRTPADFGREAVEQMVREARAAARLDHPGVLAVHEVGTVKGSGGGGFIAMELAEGGTLQELIDAAGPMDARRACRLVADAADALQYAHDLGVTHRDVKPGNLMLARDGRCKVGDFGLAYLDDQGLPTDHAVSRRHDRTRPAGTAAYLPPEIISGVPADPKGDQYSLAATLFALLAGRPPYVGSREAVLRAHVEKPPPDLGPVRPEVEAALAAVVRRGMSKDPGGRFPTIGAFGRALRPFAARTPPAAPDVPAFESDDEPDDLPAESTVGPEALASLLDSANETAARDRRRRRATAGAIAAAAGLAGAGAVGYLVLSRGGSTPVAADVPAEREAVADGFAAPIVPPPAEGRDHAAAETTGFSMAASAEEEVPVVSPLDVGRLREMTGRRVRVEGEVGHARVSRSGNVFRLSFEGNVEGVAVVWFPDEFAAMAERFGGEAGGGLLGRTVRVTGEVDLYDGDPQIVVSDPDQVEVVEAQGR